MAGLQGLGAGFIQGYGLVSDIQDRKRARDLQERRYDDQQAYREQQMGLQREQAEYARERDSVSDERWAMQREDDQAYREAQMGLRKQQLGISAMNARTSARRNDLAAQQQEIELAELNRARRESQNLRHLTAAQSALQSGDYDAYREQAKLGGLDVDRFVDPDFVSDVEVLKSTVSGAPIRRDRTIQAFNNVFRDRVNAPVGAQTPDGRTIVSSEVAGIYPSEDGNHYRLDLKLKARDKNGKITEYNAPVTPNRGPGDQHVLDVDLDRSIGHLKGLDLAIKATDKDKLASAIARERILNGDQDSTTENGTWKNGPNGTILNSKTGQTVKVVDDDGERRSEAMDDALKAYQVDNELGAVTRLSDEELELPDAQQAQLQERKRREYLQDKQRFFYELRSPGKNNSQGSASSSNGIAKASSKAEYDELPPGTQFVAPDGTVRVKP